MEPMISVGLLQNEKVSFVFNTEYRVAGKTANGRYMAFLQDDRISWDGESYDELIFTPCCENAVFTLEGVAIGIGFHWERREDQQFRGVLRLVVDQGWIVAINILPVEDYLTSVISSEMSALASVELLKSHAIISRSWLLAQLKKNKAITASEKLYSAFVETEDERIRWYDREDHFLFDVCADDHCQRYQGVARASANLLNVQRAVAETKGLILQYEGEICDARFSKCCGGVLEEFRNCWEEIDYPYLRSLRDTAFAGTLPGLKEEAEASRWIVSRPESFCNTTNKRILRQVLNNYDRETTDFYRWEVSYTQEELSKLICERSGIDFGTVIDLVPVERGVSGRLVRLKIVGTKRSMTIGKELEIRRTLSTTHLYSSAFIVEKRSEAFVLKGAGWGHGVGLCQIGAAVMGEAGYPYDEILLHYYAGATIGRAY